MATIICLMAPADAGRAGAASVPPSTRPADAPSSPSSTSISATPSPPWNTSPRPADAPFSSTSTSMLFGWCLFSGGKKKKKIKKSTNSNFGFHIGYSVCQPNELRSAH
jgi:hypothetical protein